MASRNGWGPRLRSQGDGRPAFGHAVEPDEAASREFYRIRDQSVWGRGQLDARSGRTNIAAAQLTWRKRNATNIAEYQILKFAVRSLLQNSDRSGGTHGIG